MAKQISVRCGAEIAVLVVDALRAFVDRHYPFGADECSIAARDALLGLVGQFERELVPRGRTQYSIRMRAFVCEAVKSDLMLKEAETGQCYRHRCQAIIDVCRGDSDGSGFDQARALDQAAAGPGIRRD